MKTGLLIQTLPASFNEGIGKVIVSYALLEHVLGSIVHFMLDVSHKEGRLAVRQPRAKDRFIMIRDLMELNDLTSALDLANLQTRIPECQSRRDHIGHGVWVLDAETNSRILLRVTSGTWQPDPGMRGKVKRMLKPQAVPYVPQDFDELKRFIESTTALVDHLAREIGAALGPSRRKYEQAPQTQNPPLDQADEAPPTRPEPLPE